MSETMTHAYTLTDVTLIYQGSNGDVTLGLYRHLETLGPIGVIGINLFRAQKSSERAKVYRGGGYRGMAYDRKQWAMDNLCKALIEEGERAAIAWGWGEDPATIGYPHVLYIDLPTGQVSFHTAARGPGPSYEKPWDGVTGQSADRILRWIGRLVAGTAVMAEQ